MNLGKDGFIIAVCLFTLWFSIQDEIEHVNSNIFRLLALGVLFALMTDAIYRLEECLELEFRKLRNKYADKILSKLARIR
jgi:hypothetical protein